jgi:hypothetical protein
MALVIQQSRVNLNQLVDHSFMTSLISPESSLGPSVLRTCQIHVHRATQL